MSRIGLKPVDIPSGVEVKVDGRTVTVKGSKATLSQELPAESVIQIKDNQAIVTPANDTQDARAKWGLSRALINNMVQGVTEGFTLTLEVNGVGYRAQVQGKTLKMNLGFSHEVEFTIPEGITITTPKPTEVLITGADKQLVGQVAANIRKWRKPEPYKGKGIAYQGEYIRRKEGKKK